MKSNTCEIRTVGALAAAIGIALLGTGYATGAKAGCGPDLKQFTPAAWRQSLAPGDDALAPATFTQASFSQPAITGLWKFTMTAKGNKLIPDGVQIDFGFATWHADGTELMNSGDRPPMTSNFCQGVWEQVGQSKYKLNHFALSWDSTGSVFVGPANIQELVVLDKSGMHFSGVFTITQYSIDGKTVLAPTPIVGFVTADRVTVD